MKLWLDDIRDPRQFGHYDWVWAKTAEAAIRLLKTGEVTQASLDHDLSVEATLGKPTSEELTGYHVVCWMEEHHVWPEDGVYVHSMNPVGRQKMEQVIRRAYNPREKT